LTLGLSFDGVPGCWCRKRCGLFLVEVGVGMNTNGFNVYLVAGSDGRTQAVSGLEFSTTTVSKGKTLRALRFLERKPIMLAETFLGLNTRAGGGGTDGRSTRRNLSACTVRILEFDVLRIWNTMSLIFLTTRNGPSQLVCSFRVSPLVLRGLYSQTMSSCWKSGS